MTDKEKKPVIGIIGGSGLYDMDGLEQVEWLAMNSPFGSPSDDIMVGWLDGIKLVFLPRHGRGHVHSPSAINYRANIDVLKRAGVTDVVSLSACGSLRDEYAPGDFVVVNQYIDRTVAREKSFFGAGCVAHVSMAHPTCARLGAACFAAAGAAGIRVHNGGVYLAMEGPQFSTLAESRMYREVWRADVIGMTNMPEAALAREAEMCYASMAMVTDYDSWHPDHGEVDITKIIAVLMGNVAAGKKLVAGLPDELGGARGVCECGCDRALEYAIITAPEARDEAVVAKLDAVAGRVLIND